MLGCLIVLSLMEDVVSGKVSMLVVAENELGG